jgi:RNA polymerase sigma-70 factor, ECF subfamily
MSDQELFDRLLKEHRDRVYRFALRLTGHWDQAAELTQEAFVRAFRSLDRYDRARPFESWVYTILHNVYINGLTRYEAKFGRSLDAEKEEGTVWEPTAPAAENPDRTAEREELRGVVQEALGRLPVPFRAPLILCDMEGLSYEEIGAALMCPVNTVRTRIHRARRMFRSAMAPYLKEDKIL